jgi:hypothetical protein
VAVSIERAGTIVLPCDAHATSTPAADAVEHEYEHERETEQHQPVTQRIAGTVLARQGGSLKESFMKKVSALRISLGALLVSGAVVAACSQSRPASTTPAALPPSAEESSHAPLETAQAETYARDAGLPRSGDGGTSGSAGAGAHDGGMGGAGDAGAGRRSGSATPGYSTPPSYSTPPVIPTPTNPGTPPSPGAPITNPSGAPGQDNPTPTPTPSPTPPSR